MLYYPARVLLSKAYILITQWPYSGYKGHTVAPVINGVYILARLHHLMW